MRTRSLPAIHPKRNQLSNLIPVVAGVIALVVYWLTLQPGLSGGDSAEAQFVPYTLSIMHFTGYPLYTLVGYIWSHAVLIGDVAYRMNLLSAVSGAVAVATLVWTTHLLTREWLSSIVAGLLLGSAALFWDWSTKAGVRSMNVAFMVAIIGLAIAWVQSTNTSHGGRYWVALWLIVGLSLAHHRTVILVLPGMGLYILLSHPRILRDWRAILAAILALLPGMLTYIYPLWRGANAPAYQPLPVDSFDHFLDLVLARNLSDMVTGVTWQQVPQRFGWFVEYLAAQFGAGGVIAATAGMAVLAIRKPKEGLMLWLALIFLSAFTIDYRIEGMSRLNVVFLLPVLAIVALAAGYLLGNISDGIRRLYARGVSFPKAQSWIPGMICLVFGVAVSVPMAGSSLSRVYRGNEQPMHAYREELRGMQAFRLTAYGEKYAVPGSVVVGEWEHAAAFWYEQLVDNRWKAATFRYPVDGSLGTYIEQAWNSHREIYLTRAVPGLGEGRYLSMAGPLIHILRQPETGLPGDAKPVDISYVDGLALAGYHLYTDTLRPGGVLPVSLYWTAQQALTADDSISLRLADAQGHILAQEDAVAPVLGSYPTSRWPAHVIVGDYYELGLPPDMKPGTYRLALVVYQRHADGTSRNLPNRNNGNIQSAVTSISIGQAR